MFWKFIGVLVATVALSAQGDNLGSQFNGNGGGDLAGPVMRPKTLMEQFVETLKIDQKTQAPAVQEIFAAALKEANPVVGQMMQSRQRLVNADIAANAEQTKAELDTYAAAATKMALIEAQTFSKVMATLKPNQQSKGPQAFAIMAGIFMPSGPATPARGPRGGER